MAQSSQRLEPLQFPGRFKDVYDDAPTKNSSELLNQLATFARLQDVYSLSVVVITLNEGSNIKECIRTLSFADEIIVLDSGSNDDTVEQALEFGAKVYENSDWQGFGRQKNRALEFATSEWVLSIDADERVSPELAKESLEVVRKGNFEAFEVPRLTQFCGEWIHHCGWTPDRVVRLFRRSIGKFSDDLVHERVLICDRLIGRLTFPLLHYSYPTPASYWSKLRTYSDAWALQRFHEGKRASMTRAGMAAAVAFVRTYFIRLGFLDGPMGFAVCVMQAQAAFSKYFSLYCLVRNMDLPENEAH